LRYKGVASQFLIEIQDNFFFPRVFLML